MRTHRRLPLLRADFNADYVPMHKQKLDFSNTSNPLGCAQSVRSALATLADSLAPYPDRANAQLIEAIAQHWYLSPEDIFISNGATGCIQAALSAFIKPRKTVLMPELSFPLPMFVATSMGGAAQQVPMTDSFHIDFDRMKDALAPQTAAIFLCNPNNPTGLLERPEDILAFARAVQIPVLVSEANADYAPDISLLPFKKEWPENLIVVRSFSKAHGLAGLRVGFGIAAPDMIKRILGFRLPFSVSSLSQKLATLALQDEQHINKARVFVHKELQAWQVELEPLGFTSLPPNANSLLSRVPDGCVATDLIRELEARGITVISGRSFHPRLAAYLRLAPRTQADNRQLVNALSEIMRPFRWIECC